MPTSTQKRPASSTCKPSVLKRPTSTRAMKEWHPPKRGKARALRRPIGKKVLKKPTTKYTRRSIKSKAVTRWCMDIPYIMGATERQLFRKVRSIGLLPRSTTCPRCHGGVKNFKENMQYQGRCSCRGCQLMISWFASHPFLCSGGRSLRLKLSMMVNILLGATYRSSTLQLSISQSNMQLMLLAIRLHISNYIVHQQEYIEYGRCGNHWPDVEVDEMTIGKWAAKDDKIGWHNYVGLVQRGRPESLVIYRLPDRITQKRAPGPGPIRLSDWKPIARKHLSDRGVILHSDSARAYSWAMPRVQHTKVTTKFAHLSPCLIAPRTK